MTQFRCPTCGSSRTVFLAILMITGAALGFYVLASQAQEQARRKATDAATKADQEPTWPLQGVRIDNHTLTVVPLNDGIEAVVVLDPSAFTLTGYVLNRHTGKFFARYYYGRLAGDFGLAAVQQPQFTIIGGAIDFTGTAGGTRLADAVVYVAEHSTGKVAAYGLPCDRSYLLNPPAAGQFSLIPLDAANFRFPISNRAEN